MKRMNRKHIAEIMRRLLNWVEMGRHDKETGKTYCHFCWHESKNGPEGIHHADKCPYAEAVAFIQELDSRRQVVRSVKR
jgi:hypothetical protein